MTHKNKGFTFFFQTNFVNKRAEILLLLSLGTRTLTRIKTCLSKVLEDIFKCHVNWKLLLSDVQNERLYSTTSLRTDFFKATGNYLKLKSINHQTHILVLHVYTGMSGYCLVPKWGLLATQCAMRTHFITWNNTNDK